MRYYENLAKTSENRLPQRSYYIPENEGAYTLLNGTWRFHYYESDYDVEQNITDWDTIPVPACWQMHGYENPNYTNTEYPHPVDAPYAPDINPCGVYEREFEIADTDNRTYLVLEGVSSVGRVSVNGKYVGFTMGSHLQAEFDLTEYVVKGTNTLRIEVVKWSLGSYLEDQDFFRFHGLFRDVYLLSRPQGHIVDIDIRTVDNQDIVVKFEGEAKITLLDQGQILAQQDAKGEAIFHIDNPVLWNAEKPYLYELKFEYKNEVITQKVGFRTIRISDKYEVLINDTPVKIQGVNRHDTNAEKGWTMSNEDLKSEMEAMKKLNINCIRTSHYPPTPYLLNLCDEMGFYVVLETDIETHGYGKRDARKPGREGYDVECDIWPCQNIEWKPEWIERMQRAVIRDKNHPSIFMWSTGNESGFGENQKAMIKWAREYDGTRLIHCEDADRKADRTDRPEYYNERYYADVYSRMYLPIDVCKAYCEDPKKDQPMYLCEYAHAMGVGPGDICDYWETLDLYPKWVGGCVWEWADHTVLENGVPKYGGDWETELVDFGNFCCDGMVCYDRSFKSGSYEVKTAYQPMRVYLEEGRIRVFNRQCFTNLKEYTLKYELMQDGIVLQQWETQLDVQPRENTYLELPASIPATCKYGCYLNFKLYDKTGYEVAMSQIDLDVAKESIGLVTELAELTEDKKNIYAKGANYEYTFSKLYGTFVSLKVNGEEKLASRMQLSTYRAPIDNERRVKKMWEGPKFLDNTSENMNRAFNKIYSCEIVDGIIRAEGSLGGVSRMPYLYYTTKVTIGADGRIDWDVTANTREGCCWLQRFGYEFALTDSNASFKYFGKGPGENYQDLGRYAAYGLWESDAKSEYFPYIMPQEHGNHVGVSYLAFAGGVTFAADTAFEANVSIYSTKDLAEAQHIDELKADGYTHVRIDYKDSGIGSNSCGPVLLEKYQLDGKNMNLKFSMML